MTVICPRSYRKSMTDLGINQMLAIKSNRFGFRGIFVYQYTKTKSKQNIWENVYMMQINQINFVLLAFFTVKKRRSDKLYLDNTELAVFAWNPSIFDTNVAQTMSKKVENVSEKKLLETKVSLEI